MKQRELLQVHLPIQGPISATEYFSKTQLYQNATPVPRLGIGTAGLGGVWGTIDRTQSVAVLHDAWRNGFLLTDTSPNYNHGGAEEILGLALKSWQGEAPILCTKLDGYGESFAPQPGETWRDALDRQFRTSQQRFDGQPIAALAIHDPEACPPEYAQACIEYQLERISAHDIKCIGIGGGGPRIQSATLRANPGQFRYLITYLRLSAINLQALADIIPEARQQGVAIIAASPLFMGLLGAGFAPQNINPAANLAPVFIERARAVKSLSEKQGMSLPHLALRFVLSMPMVDYVLAGADTSATWADTLAAYQAGPLPADLYAQIWNIAQTGEEPIIGG